MASTVSPHNPRGVLPRVRVYLPTYRRRELLPRAVDSLLAQTHANWICELHNDDPRDPFPGELVWRKADPRIEFHLHERNLGPIASFNLFYRPTVEPFSAILEDDNWWEPTFLEKMLVALEAFPDATLAWCNQRVWEERPDGSWKDTSTLVNAVGQSADDGARPIPWGLLQQTMGGVHATGGMLLRSQAGKSYVTPDIPLAGVEPYRERLIPHPLVYVPQPLAIFARTLQTARQNDPGKWGAIQVALAATFVQHGGFDLTQLKVIWSHYKKLRPPMTNELIATALISCAARPFLHFAGPRDWWRFLLNATRHPRALVHKLRVRTEHQTWWTELDRATAQRFSETKTNPADNLTSFP